MTSEQCCPPPSGSPPGSPSDRLSPPQSGPRSWLEVWAQDCQTCLSVFWSHVQARWLPLELSSSFLLMFPYRVLSPRNRPALAFPSGTCALRGSSQWPLCFGATPQGWSRQSRGPLSAHTASRQAQRAHSGTLPATQHCLSPALRVSTGGGGIYCKKLFLFVFFNKLKVCGNPTLGKSIGAFFLTAFAHFVSLCRTWSFSQYFKRSHCPYVLR